jgi:hypothetical protein
VVDPAVEPALGALAAAGPRAAGAPADYAIVVEAVREGYLLHYAEPRLLSGHDADLALLAGDYLYALGIERLAGLGDTAAVRELSDLISLAAECHAEGRVELAAPLWLACTVAVGCGATPAHDAAKQSARLLATEAGAQLRDAAHSAARTWGLEGELDRAGQAIDFPGPRLNASG